MHAQQPTNPRPVRWLLAIAALLVSGPAMAQGVFFDGLTFIPLCSGPVVGPALANLDGGDEAELLVPNLVTTLQQDADVDGLAEVDQKLSLKAFDQNGAQLWVRQNLTTISNDVAIAQPFLDTVLIGTVFDVPDRMLGLFTFGIECFNVGVAQVGANRYVTVAVGISAAEGNPQTGQDLTKINVWVLNAATGAVVFKHTIRPRGSRFWSAVSSGVFDPDGDGDDELVSVYAKLNNPETIEWKAFIFDLESGQKERDLIFFQRVAFDNLN
jgi:hypothetical protein